MSEPRPDGKAREPRYLRVRTGSHKFTGPRGRYGKVEGEITQDMTVGVLSTSRAPGEGVSYLVAEVDSPEDHFWIASRGRGKGFY